MKKLTSLMMALCLCLSVCCLFASCGSSPKVVGQGKDPDVYTIEYSARSSGNPLQTITFGKDSNGNIHYTVNSHYTENTVSEEFVYINTGSADAPDYKVYKYNPDTLNYEYMQDSSAKYGMPHYDYFKQGWYNKNNANLKGFKCVEVESLEANEDSSVKSLLDGLGCKYYKYQKDDSDGYAIMAVLPDLDIVLYYGTNFEGYGSQASYYGGSYETKFLVKDFELDHTENYADLIK